MLHKFLLKKQRPHYKLSAKFFTGILLFLSLSTSIIYAQAPICATPGADGPLTQPSPNNTFFPAKGGNVTLATGTTELELDGVPDPFLVGSTVYNFGSNQI